MTQAQLRQEQAHTQAIAKAKQEGVAYFLKNREALIKDLFKAAHEGDSGMYYRPGFWMKADVWRQMLEVLRENMPKGYRMWYADDGTAIYISW